MTIQKTAYTNWLTKIAQELLQEDVGDERDIISHLLFQGCSQDNNPQSFEIVSEVGDNKWSQETFYKAADLVISLYRQQS
jgi:hypothetical protein